SLARVGQAVHLELCLVGLPAGVRASDSRSSAAQQNTCDTCVGVALKRPVPRRSHVCRKSRDHGVLARRIPTVYPPGLTPDTPSHPPSELLATERLKRSRDHQTSCRDHLLHMPAHAVLVQPIPDERLPAHSDVVTGGDAQPQVPVFSRNKTPIL